MRDTTAARHRMVEQQIVRRGVDDAHVLEAMRTVPREAFVPEDVRDYAYEDCALPIEAGQTISQPYIVAAMIAAADVKPGQRVLEVGAGSGYAAAVLSRIAAQVCAVERHAELADAAAARLARLGYGNVDLRCGDGAAGWPDAAPFDAIIVSAGGRSAPPALKQQLVIGGRLIIPIGVERGRQTLTRITRRDEDRFDQEPLAAVAFVPLVSTQGWPED
ncbi:MAG: protein-L-isoaspartate(D-aspartate) O-methyltransferase [Hyphomonadaceae bacterium]